MYRIAVLTNSRAQEAFLTEQILQFCAEHCLFPQMDCYHDQESFFETARSEPLTNAVIALPGVDGLNAVEHLRALCPQTRVIWCSDLDFSLHAFRLRADYFLLEPVTEAALRQGFCIWLDQKKIRQSSADLTATNTTRRTVYEKEKDHPFCVKLVADRSIVPVHGRLRRYADARRQRRSFAARCTIRCGAALFCTDDLCGAAGKGIEPQAGGGKPLYGQERCKHSSRRL